MSTLPEKLEAALARRQARLEGFACPFRGKRIGRRECEGCGGRRAHDLFACSLRAYGATLEDCRNCGKRPRGLGEIVPALRKAICLECPQHRIEDGAVRCALCTCAEPWKSRPWCPAKKWGIEEWQRRRAAEDGSRGGAETRREEARRFQNEDKQHAVA